jgi:hypothetical protein
MSRKNRMRHNRQQKELPSHEEEPNIEVLDAPEIEEELEVVSTEKDNDSGEEDAIGVLRRNLESANKAKEESERRYQEAEAHKRRLAEENSRLASSEIVNYKAVLEHAYTAAMAEGEKLESAYAEAMHNGDYVSAAKAQRSMVQYESKMERMREAYQGLEQQEKAPKAPVPQTDAFEEYLSKLHPGVQGWVRSHKNDLLNNPKAEQLALAADRMAVAKGYEIGSEEYLDFLDEAMGYSDMDNDSSEREPTRRTQTPREPRRQAMPAAPVSRNNGGKVDTVYLDQTDKQIARSLNMTDREYAVFKIKAEDPNDPRVAKLGMSVGRGVRR